MGDRRDGPDAGHLCVGLISGTSVDGVDAALVRITGGVAARGVELRRFVSVPYPDAVRDELLALYGDRPEHAIARLCSLAFVLGELFAEAALEVCRQAGVAPAALHAIGSHGQTVWHQPDPDPARPLSVRSTLQVAEPAVIAERTGATVVANFRVADVAAGGQGAPLVPYFDWVVLRDPGRTRAVQNIGGIGNVTYLPAGGGIDTVRAFDTGPGNMLVDGLTALLTGGTAAFDRDGRLAAAGTVDAALLDALLADPYLAQEPPKTTGRERYGRAYCADLLRDAGVAAGTLAPESDASERDRECARDLLATATRFTARSIADAYRRWCPALDEVFVGGGGARNPTLMAALAAELAPVPVAPVEELGVDSRAKEAMAFALLAHDALAGLPTNVPAATGARRAMPLGTVVPPGPRR